MTCARGRRPDIYIVRSADTGGAHIETLLGAQLFDEQNLWDAKLGADVRDDLAVDEILLEPNVPPHWVVCGALWRVVIESIVNPDLLSFA